MRDYFIFYKINDTIFLRGIFFLILGLFPSGNIIIL